MCFKKETAAQKEVCLTNLLIEGVSMILQHIHQITWLGIIPDIGIQILRCYFKHCSVG